MGKFVNMFGLCMQHIQNIITDTTKQLNCAKLQGKFDKLIESKVIFRAVFLLDILAEIKSSVFVLKKPTLISLPLLIQLKALNATVIN